MVKVFNFKRGVTKISKRRKKHQTIGGKERLVYMKRVLFGPIGIRILFMGPHKHSNI
jgi:hypothetical protein